MGRIDTLSNKTNGLSGPGFCGIVINMDNGSKVNGKIFP